MNKLQLSLFATGVGLGLGIFATNSGRNLAVVVGLVGSGGLIASGGTIAITRKLNGGKYRKLTSEKNKLAASQTTLEGKFEQLQSTNRQVQLARDNALQKVTELTAQIKLLTEQKVATDNLNIQHEKTITQLEALKRQLISDVEKLQEIVANKEAQIKEHLDDWKEDVENEADRIFKIKAREAVLKEIKHDEQIAAQAIEIAEKLWVICDEMFDDNEKHHEVAMGVNNQAKFHIEKIIKDKNLAIQDLQDLNRLLESKVQHLTDQLNGEILEPEKRKDEYGKYWTIANSLIDRMAEKDIPLRITGLEELPNGSAVVAFGFSRSASPVKLIEIFNKNGKVWAFRHGIHFIGNARLSPRFPAIEVSVVRDKPDRESTESIYKDGLVPAKLFAETVYKALNPKKKGKPTLRVMGATGDGKGIAIKNLLAYFVEQDGWELWLSDPVADSDEDYWDCPKIATDTNSARKAYSEFVNLHETRYQTKIKGFTSRDVLAVFDEFDREHSEEQHEQAQKIMTSIRHTGLRQILVGQCAEVGKNGWTWDDMKNCSLLALEGSIGTLKKHLTTDMGWTRPKVTKLGKEYDKYRKWADEQNAENPDRPVENQTRLGLLVIGDSYQFLEIPMAYKGFICASDACTVRELLDVNVANNTLSEVDTVIQSAENKDKEIPIYCPKCRSKSITEIDAYSDGRRRFRCGKGHRFPIQPEQIRE